MRSDKSITAPNEEESKFFWWATLTLILSLAAWLWGHYCGCRFASEYLSATIAGLAGGVLTSAFVLYRQRIKKEYERQAFFHSLTRSVWRRKVAYQYGSHKMPQLVVALQPELKIQFKYRGGRVLEVKADYGKGWGEVTGKVEFDDDNRLVGQGTYVYTSGDLAEYRMPANKEATEFITVAHSGKYTFHLFPDHDQNTIRVFYEGLIPYPEARGFEVWTRAGMN